MWINATFGRLSDEADWQALCLELSLDPSKASIRQLRAHLTRLGVHSAIIEAPYIDRDFSADHRAFYSQSFKMILRWCRRVHFFRCETGHLETELDVKKRKAALGALKDDYLGFAVIRPLRHAPIGRTVLVQPVDPPGRKSELLVRAQFKINLFGECLYVRGAAFMEQDQQATACAQVSLWTLARHFHTRFSHRWHSTADISEFGTAVTEAAVMRQLPAGAGGLTWDGMARALKAMGYQPLIYTGERADKGPITWKPELTPLSVINRYVDSGLPVIIGLLLPNQTLHAVTGIGATRRQIPHLPTTTVRPTTSVFVDAIMIHDDQRGAYLNFPANPAIASDPDIPAKPYCSDFSGKEIPLSISENVLNLMVALPERVLSTAEAAEAAAHGFTRQFATGWADTKKLYKANTPGSVKIAEEYFEAVAGNCLVYRTYLTTGAKYKAHLIQNIAHQTVIECGLKFSLPPYVWVTEFGRFDDLNEDEPKSRRIMGHVVIDATTSHHHAAILIVHQPGLLITRDLNPTNGAPFKDTTYLIDNDVVYLPRERST
jgi:hypothetical protein